MMSRRAFVSTLNSYKTQRVAGVLVQSAWPVVHMPRKIRYSFEKKNYSLFQLQKLVRLRFLTSILFMSYFIVHRLT